MFRRTFIGLIGCLAAACAHSSREMYGGTARYSADDHAWVAEQDAKRWIFRDPVTGCALQCRADVERWVKVNVSLSHTVNKNDGAIGTGMLVTLPLALPALLLFLPTLGVTAALKAPSAQAHHSRGDEARKRGASNEAGESYLLALVNGDKSAAEPLAQLWLEQGRNEDALRARQMLLCAGSHLGEAHWNRVESWLRSQGSTIPQCSDSSREPIPIPWED